MNIIFIILCLIHILIWMFVLLAFVNKNTARINIYIVIPLIYLLHCFPIHILIYCKKKIYKNSYLTKESQINKFLIIPNIYKNLQNSLYKFCTFNPISPQGMLIFGLLSSLFKLYPIKYNNIIQHD